MNNKVLLVTGKKAENLVKKHSSETDVETKVKVLPISIASFLNLNILLKELERVDVEEFSMILIPGLAEFDLEKAENEIGIPIFKGPKHAADIPIVLDNLDRLELSKKVPASEFLKEEISYDAGELLQKLEKKARKKLNKSENFKVGKGEKSVFAGPDFPPRIVAEITDAPLLSNEKLIEIGERYVKSGAEILDIGMTTQEDMSKEIPRIISVLRGNFDLPLSIDTTNEDEIKTALDEGIDLVVSIDGASLKNFEKLNTPAVIIPRNPEEDYYPTDTNEKVSYLEDLLEKADDFGFEKVLADPILEPVGRGFSDSFTAYHKLSKERTGISLFMGIGNVIELFDADSIGMAALLLGGASELNIDFILSVEASNKTLGNICEISTARDMMILAEHRDSVPKDLGIDLLKLKEKRKLSDPYDKKIEKEAKIIEASGDGDFPRDKKGFFNIYTEDKKIIAVFHSFTDSNIVIKGNTANEISKEILERELVSELSHAAYLGRELQKAEIAIKTNRGYIQEEKIF